MKKILFLMSMTMLFTLCAPNEVFAQKKQKKDRPLLRAIGQGIKQVAGTVGSAIVYDIAINSGMSNDDAATTVEAATWLLGGDESKVKDRIGWIDGSKNGYDMRDEVSTWALKTVGEVTGKEEIFDIIIEAKEAHSDYLSAEYNFRHGDASINLDSVRSATSQRWGSVIVDAYEYNQDKKEQERKQRIRKELDMDKKMSVYTPEHIDEFSGLVLAVATSDIYSNDEKKEILTQYGIIDSEHDLDMVLEIVSEDYIVNEGVIQEGPTEEELEQQRIEERNRVKEIINHASLASFDFDVVDLSVEQQFELDSLVILLDEHQDINVEIVGHTCNLGTKNINAKVGLKRANAVKEYLVDKGVGKNRIYVSSQGEYDPLYPNNTKDNRISNRSVSFQTKESVVNIDTYNLNQIELIEKQLSELDNAIILLNEKPELNIEIIGHTCNLGSEKINNEIGLKRANVAKDYLLNSGISEERISLSSHGERNPIRPNDSEENRKANRRITIEVK